MVRCSRCELLTSYSLDVVSVKREPKSTVSCVQSQEHDAPSRKTPPAPMAIDMSDEQRAALVKLRDKVPPYLHDFVVH